MFAAVWGSPFVVDGKVYLGDEDGDVVVLQHGKEKKVLARDEHGQRRLRDVVPANGTLFLNNRSQLFALAAAKSRSWILRARQQLLARARRWPPIALRSAQQPDAGAASPADEWRSFAAARS